MHTPPTFDLAPPRVRRKRRAIGSPGPVALMLVAAEFDPSVSVTLTFDRDIDITSLVASAVIVNDAPEAIAYRGDGPGTLLTPRKVVIALVEDGGQGGPVVTLTAGAGNGIVADDDGGTWAGVTDVALPFPP